MSAARSPSVDMCASKQLPASSRWSARPALGTLAPVRMDRAAVPAPPRRPGLLRTALRASVRLPGPLQLLPAALGLLLTCCVTASVATPATAAPAAASAASAASAAASKQLSSGPGWVRPQTARHDPAALAQVAEQVDKARAAGKTPVVVFDLDHTLFDGRPRTLVILAEFAATLPAAQRKHADAIRKLSLQGISYLLKDTLRGVGVVDPQLVAAAEAYWKPRFFSDRYVDLDVPIAGAADYVRDLWRRGALVIYLSGRNADGMLAGTTTSLQKWGFPLGVRGAQLILKPRFDEPDDTFKQASLDHISALGQVVGSFENEPGNLAAMALRWPEAAVVFLDTDFNPKGPVKAPPASARWLGDYADYAPPAP
jgi:hypothetical protein